MAHYTHWLLIPSLIGLPVQIICWSENNYNTPGQVGFACLLVIWAVCMLEFWKRKEKTLALKRGMLEYEDTEVDRPGISFFCVLLGLMIHRQSLKVSFNHHILMEKLKFTFQDMKNVEDFLLQH